MAGGDVQRGKYCFLFESTTTVLCRSGGMVSRARFPRSSGIRIPGREHQSVPAKKFAEGSPIKNGASLRYDDLKRDILKKCRNRLLRMYLLPNTTSSEELTNTEWGTNCRLFLEEIHFKLKEKPVVKTGRKGWRNT